jgi:hypothetical protein
MFFKIFISPNTLTSYQMEDLFKSRSKRYIDLVRFEDSSEYRLLDNYFKSNYKVSLYDLLLRTLYFSIISKDNDYCILNFLNHSLVDGLNTEGFLKLLLNGNLDIKKTYLIQNMICYGFKNR